MNNDFDNLLDRINKPAAASEEIPAPGTEENPWIGFNRIVNGQRQFYALSGAERRRSIRASRGADAAEQRKGQRRYNRQQRKQEFDKGTIRQQMRILRGEIQTTVDMRDNLARHVMRQTRLNERADHAEERRQDRAQRREERLIARSHARVDAGTARHADLVRLGLRPYVTTLHTDA